MPSKSQRQRDQERRPKSRLESIKERLDNLGVGKVVMYDNTMNLATQYAMDYKLDVEYLLQRLKRYETALKDAKEALDNQYRSNGGIIENNKAYMAIFNALEVRLDD